MRYLSETGSNHRSLPPLARRGRGTSIDIEPSRPAGKFVGAGHPFHSRRRTSPLKIGLLVPFQGADAIWGPSCQYSAVLAAAEINSDGGILGRQIELLATDAGGKPEDVVDRALGLLEREQVDALVGVHLSSVRQALSRALGGRVAYVFAPPHEGSREEDGDVFAIGEVPAHQFPGSIEWLMRRVGTRRWLLVGNDYVWPRKSHRWVRSFIEANGGLIVDEIYVRIGDCDTSALLDRIEAVSPDAVFQSLVGSECVPFNRGFAERGLADRIVRLSGAIEENTLMAIGEGNTRNLYGAAGYFSTLATLENARFIGRYREAFGSTAPVQGALSQSCYEALQFLRALAGRAGNFRPTDLHRAAEGVRFLGARGETIVRDGVARTPTFLAAADGTRFRIVQRFDPALP